MPLRRSMGDGADGGCRPGSQSQLQAQVSVYRLALRSAVLEAHFTVRIYSCYPLCPPVFTTTKLLDVSRNMPIALTTVANEVACLEQQVRDHPHGRACTRGGVC